MNPEHIRELIAKFPFWYHKINLPFGITTPGWAPINHEAYRIPESLVGKRILDVGAWDGYWTFEALRRGAEQAVAIDDFSDYLGCLASEDRKAWETFDTCRDILGHNDKQCPRMEISVYDVNPDLLGLFDTVFFFGTLYHLRYPQLAIDRLASVCRGEIFIESAILDDFSPYRGGLGHGYPGGQMLMEFYPDDQYAENTSNWWVPTLDCLMQMVRSAGFEAVEGWKLTDHPDQLGNCRGFVKGIKPAVPVSSNSKKIHSPPKGLDNLSGFLREIESQVYPEAPSLLHSEITRQAIQRLGELVALKPGARVLDVGCGQGPALTIFQRMGLLPVGVTINEEDLAACRKEGFTVVNMDQSFLDFSDESFNVIWARHVVEHSIFPLFTLTGFSRVLKAGGALYLEVPAHDTACHHERNPNHYSMLPKSSWISLLQRAGFQLVEVSDYQFNVPAGDDTYWGFYCSKLPSGQAADGNLP